MRILPEPLVFEWDEGNFSKNEQKHGVTNKEAEEVFIHRPLLVFDDLAHSLDEKRYQALGKTDNQRLVFVAYTVRNMKIRVISIRLMDKKERRIYEQTEKAQKTSGI